ncbi:MAG TPA: hypothetical protein VIH18_26115 [Candidatus Binatia bacterium]
MGDDVDAKHIHYPAEEIIDYWKRMWLSKRLKDDAVVKAIDSFTPEQARISRLLEQENA